MDRCSNAAWVSPQAVHTLTARDSGNARLRPAPLPEAPRNRVSPFSGGGRTSPIPGRVRRPPAEPAAAHLRSHPLIPPRENRTFEGLRRPPARRAEPGTRRTAARLSPTPERRRRPEVRRLFSPLQSHPAAGAWLSLAEHLVRDQGVAGSNPAAPTRPVPQTVPADGFPKTGSGRRVPAPRRPRRPAVSDAFSPPFSTQESGCHFGTHPWFKTCIFRRSCRRRFVSAGALFLALAP